MKRRELLRTGAAAGIAAVAAGAALAQEASAPAQGPFKLRYAPHFGMFEHHAGKDLLSQLQFMADEGFTAFEDNWMGRRPIEEQERIAREMERLGMTMGVFVAEADFGAPTFVRRDEGTRQRLVDTMKQAVETAKRVRATWCTVVPGRYEPGVEWEYQTANCIENLKACAEVCEPSGLVMVLESLNPWRDHPGLFLTRIPQVYMICEAVGSPSVKILDDLYHQQVTEGNLIPNMNHAWDQIAYFQIGDNPGRNEPTTGEINYRNVFKHIHGRGFEGILGMEHGRSQGGKEGERAVIDAYRECDDF